MLDLTNMTCPSCSKLYGTNPLECPQCLKYCNWSRLLLTPVIKSTEPDMMEHSQKIAIEHVSKFIQLFEMTLDQQYQFMRMMEGLAAGASLAYQARIIKERVPDPDKVERKAKDYSAALKQQKIDNLPVKEKKLLTARDKAIASLVKFGISQELAEKQVDDKMGEMGRRVELN